jgi:hypothetical protein
MILKLFLLDGAQGLIILPFFFLLHMVSTIFIEGGILYLFGYKKFGKSCLDALIVNICSLAFGLMCLSIIRGLTPHIHIRVDPLFISLFLYYIQTIIVEGILLKVLNKSFPLKKLIVADLLMNLVTYFTLYYILTQLEKV